MKLDDEEQRAILLELINKSQFLGEVAEKVSSLKHILSGAELEKSKRVKL